MDKTQIELLHAACDGLKLAWSLVEAARRLENRQTTDEARILFLAGEKIANTKTELDRIVEDHQ